MLLLNIRSLISLCRSD